MTVTGGTFIGSAVGHDNDVHDNTIVVGDVREGAPLDELRTMIAAVREELVRAAGGPDARAEVRYEVRKIEEELAGEQPKGSVVLSRWEQVSKVLSPVAAASGIIAQVTDLIMKVFGGS